MPEQGGEKAEVFFAAGDEFAHGKVVDFQAPARSAPSVFVVNGHQAITPPARQGRGCFINTVRIVAERFMENGSLADRTVDQDGIRGAIAWEDIASTETSNSLGASG